MNFAQQIIARLAWKVFQLRFSTSSSDLHSFPTLPPLAQRKVLGEHLLALVHHFGCRADALPEWRSAARSATASNIWNLWPELPILTKEMLRERFQPEQMQRKFNLKGMVKTTGGSTGQPTAFFHDVPMIRAANAASLFAQRQMGWRPGMAMVKIWGSERDIGRATSSGVQIWNKLLQVHLIDGYAAGDATLNSFVDLLQKHPGAAVWGFTSLLDLVARAAIEKGRRPAPGSVSVAWNGGEMLLPEHVDAFRKAFGVPILNLYGGREFSVIAAQFAESQALHIMRPWIFAEIVDDAGRPAAVGGIGRLVLTSTVCRGTPFLRYEIGDLASASAAHYTEAGITHLEALHGRSSGLFRLPDGRNISNLFWNHLFKDIPEVHQFQVRIQEKGDLRILLQGLALSVERQQRLQQTITNFLGEVPFTLEPVDSIPLTPQGKRLQVVRESSPGSTT